MTDTTNPMVPTHSWGHAAREFGQHAPLQANPQSVQLSLCATCVRQGEFTPPSAIVTIQGTVYCPSHAA